MVGGKLTRQTVEFDLDVVRRVANLTRTDNAACVLELAALLTVTQVLDGEPVLWTVVVDELGAVVLWVGRAAAAGAGERVWVDVLTVHR